MPSDRIVNVRPASKTKVFWSETEKAQVIAAAIAIQAERPEMAGLPLLREAICSLPSSRRRKVIALSQAAWFEEGMRAEVKRLSREKAASADDAANMRALRDTQVDWKAEHEDWKAEHSDWHSEWRVQLDVLKQILETLQAAVDRLDVISEKLGSPVPTYARAQSQAKARARRHTN